MVRDRGVDMDNESFYEMTLNETHNAAALLLKKAIEENARYIILRTDVEFNEVGFEVVHNEAVKCLSMDISDPNIIHNIAAVSGSFVASLFYLLTNQMIQNIHDVSKETADLNRYMVLKAAMIILKEEYNIDLEADIQKMNEMF